MSASPAFTYTIRVSYAAVIGLETHVQLKTSTKIFCRCPNRFGAPPNTLICPVCLGYPGALPVLNQEAVDQAIKLALALRASVLPESCFARKSYFYADLPKGYQISQFDRPLARGGRLKLVRHSRTIRIRRLHLEEDAGKLLHASPRSATPDGTSLVDFNRSGIPLVEIVSEPDLHTPREAYDFLRSLHEILLFTGTSDGNMEDGSLRCDANVSIRASGSAILGTRTEIKNLNSFRHVARAVEEEIDRQSQILEAGGEVAQETRTFDAASRTTRRLRNKGDSHDYRYLPEPDLPLLILPAKRIRRLAEALPELPERLRERLMRTWDLPMADALQLGGTPQLADYFERAARRRPDNPRGVGNWIKTEVVRELKARKLGIEDAVAPERLAQLVGMVDSGRLSSSSGKQVLAEMWHSAESAAAIAARLGLEQIRDEDRIWRWVRQVTAENRPQTEAYRAGRRQLLGFFVGRIMALSKGRAEPRTVQRLLRRWLDADESADNKPSHLRAAPN